MSQRVREDHAAAIKAHAWRHTKGITLTIEIPETELPGDNLSDRLTFGADFVAAAYEAMSTPKPGSLFLLRGGKN